MRSQDMSQIVTFKADPALVAAMEGIANRSEFIRAAVLAALEGVCPLCQGTGVLSLRQRQHWHEFEQHHAVQRCGDCHERHIVCTAADGGVELP